jgi:hypothetical protein
LTIAPEWMPWRATRPLGKTSDGKVILRFENLNAANGPDHHVYLSQPVRDDAAGDERPEVGKLKRRLRQQL